MTEYGRPEAGLTRGLPTITPAKAPSHPPALCSAARPRAAHTPDTAPPAVPRFLSSHIPVRPKTTGQATILHQNSPTYQSLLAATPAPTRLIHLFCRSFRIFTIVYPLSTSVANLPVPDDLSQAI